MTVRQYLGHFAQEQRRKRIKPAPCVFQQNEGHRLSWCLEETSSTSRIRYAATTTTDDGYTVTVTVEPDYDSYYHFEDEGFGELKEHYAHENTPEGWVGRDGWVLVERHWRRRGTSLWLVSDYSLADRWDFNWRTLGMNSHDARLKAMADLKRDAGYARRILDGDCDRCFMTVTVTFAGRELADDSIGSGTYFDDWNSMVEDIWHHYLKHTVNHCIEEHRKQRQRARHTPLMTPYPSIELI